MTRRPARSSAAASDDADNVINSKQNLSPLCNGHTGRTITRQSSQELLKVQCNGLTTSHRNSKLLSPSGSDVLPLPTSRRSTRRASASWCGSTRELSQLSPTDSEIENIRRSESTFETHDATLDSPGITLRPKGQLWLPIALIGTTAEENGNCIRKRYDYSIPNTKLSNDFLDSLVENVKNENDENPEMPRISKESDSSFNSNASSLNEYQIKKNTEKKDTYCIITRNTKIKNEEMNGGSRESSVENQSQAAQEQPGNRVEGQKRSLSVCDSTSPSVKRTRTMSANSALSVAKKKKLSPEEKLLQDNKEYFKMEVLNNKLRSSSLLNGSQIKDSGITADNGNSGEKINKIIIKKIKMRGKRRRSRWTKEARKKNNEVNYAAIIIENKKNNNNNLKVNGVIKKKRQSELMKLCNEAESFMFGESSRQGSTTTNTESDLEEMAKKKGHFGVLINEEISRDSNCENEVKTRKKRRSHAEAFIHDNLDYYKFETPGSRLRYQGSFLDVKSEDKDFIYTLKQRKKERLSTEQNKKNEPLEKLQVCVEVKEEKIDNHERRNNMKPSEELENTLFSFESIPVTEPWYEVYKRQDEGMENYYPLLSDPSDQPFLLPYELPRPSYPRVPALSEYYKRKRKKLAHLFNHPRKSPRCHASTLAILSSLKRRKRRSGTSISINSVLGEYPPPNVSSPEENPEIKHESEKNAEEEDILDLLLKEESYDEADSIFFEPFSDSESKPKGKDSESCRSVKSDEEDLKTVKTINRNKKFGKVELQSDIDLETDENKFFSLQTIKPDSFFKDMMIETRKKSGLNVDIITIIENLRNCESMEDAGVNLISDLNGSSIGLGLEKNVRRKKRKARKINKTGWDNRKSRRRTGNKIAEIKEIESGEVLAKPMRVKTKVKTLEDGICSENIIVGSKRRLKCRDSEKKPPEPESRLVLRSHSENAGRTAGLVRAVRGGGSLSGNLDSNPRDFPPCVVKVKKIKDSCLGSDSRLRCPNGSFSLQRRLILRRKKKRVVDYAWTTKKR